MYNYSKNLIVSVTESKLFGTVKEIIYLILFNQIKLLLKIARPHIFL